MCPMWRRLPGTCAGSRIIRGKPASSAQRLPGPALHRNLDHLGERLATAIEKHLPQGRFLRQKPEVWCPSAGTPCGIAEYTRSWTAHTARCRVANQAAPTVNSVLHLEHHTGIVNDEEVLQVVRRCRQRNTHVSITMHTVEECPRSFEEEADVLIALHPKGAERLQHRHAGKQVVYPAPRVSQVAAIQKREARQDRRSCRLPRTA